MGIQERKCPGLGLKRGAKQKKRIGNRDIPDRSGAIFIKKLVSKSTLHALVNIQKDLYVISHNPAMVISTLGNPAITPPALLQKKDLPVKMVLCKDFWWSRQPYVNDILEFLTARYRFTKINKLNLDNGDIYSFILLEKRNSLD